MGITDYAIRHHTYTHAQISFGLLHGEPCTMSDISNLFQATNCQWMLDVVLSRFENGYNAETRNSGDLVCCCDTDEDMCVENLGDLPKDCTNECDTWFEVSVSPCESQMNRPWLCSLSSEVIEDSDKVVDIEYVFHFTTYSPAEIGSKVTPQ